MASTEIPPRTTRWGVPEHGAMYIAGGHSAGVYYWGSMRLYLRFRRGPWICISEQGILRVETLLASASGGWLASWSPILKRARGLAVIASLRGFPLSILLVSIGFAPSLGTSWYPVGQSHQVRCLGLLR
jgi:hypothetical protein